MPYIKQEDRYKYDAYLNSMPPIENKGDLEYCVYKLMLKYMSSRAYRYSNLHDAVYATVHSAHEFERRFLDPREYDAITENGDIK